MIRKFAIALIATTMLVAPALAADAVKSTPAPVAAATTAAPAVTTKTEIKTATKHATKHLAKTDKHLKTVKVAHRHSVHHMTFAKSGKHPSHVVSAKVSKPAKAVKATPAASPATWFQVKTDKPVKTFRVAHHHAHHLMVAKHGGHVKTVKVSKPVKTVTAPATISTPVVSTVAKPAVKVIKVSKAVKKIKVAHRHTVRHLSIAKNGQHATHIKTAKVSKPVKHANVSKTHKQVTHVVAKSSKVIAN
jgi:hypothetical protein